MVFEDWELKFMKKHGLPGNLQTPRMIKTTKRKLQEQMKERIIPLQNYILKNKPDNRE